MKLKGGVGGRGGGRERWTWTGGEEGGEGEGCGGGGVNSLLIISSVTRSGCDRD